MSAGTMVLMAAIPMFVILLGLEVLSFRFAPDEDKRGYYWRDSATSVSMGFGFLIVEVGCKIVSLRADSAAVVTARLVDVGRAVRGR
jgi:hypothetical protein